MKHPLVFRNHPELRSWLQKKQLVGYSPVLLGCSRENILKLCRQAILTAAGKWLDCSGMSGFTIEPPGGFMFQSHYNIVSLMRDGRLITNNIQHCMTKTDKMGSQIKWSFPQNGVIASWNPTSHIKSSFNSSDTKCWIEKPVQRADWDPSSANVNERCETWFALDMLWVPSNYKQH